MNTAKNAALIILTIAATVLLTLVLTSPDAAPTTVAAPEATTVATPEAEAATTPTAPAPAATTAAPQAPAPAATKAPVTTVKAPAATAPTAAAPAPVQPVAAKPTPTPTPKQYEAAASFYMYGSIPNTQYNVPKFATLTDTATPCGRDKFIGFKLTTSHSNPASLSFSSQDWYTSAYAANAIVTVTATYGASGSTTASPYSDPWLIDETINGIATCQVL